MRDLKVKLGVAKEQEEDSLQVLAVLPETQGDPAIQANTAVSLMAGDEEVEVLDDTDDAL